MSKLLLVTAVCAADIALVEKRLQWLLKLGPSEIPSDLLFVNDGSLSDLQVATLVARHKPIYRDVYSRKILDRSIRTEWPYSVNHVWRTTAAIVAGLYGEPLDISKYFAWFYFEPDVTPLNKDWAAIIENQYAFHRKQFLGYVHETTGYRASQQRTITMPGMPPAPNQTTMTPVTIRHMNGACCYPITMEHYNQRMMLVENVPWDVAGLDGEVLSTKAAEMPPTAYSMAFGTTGYAKMPSGTYVATQTLRDGTTRAIEVSLTTQIVHHGCKDGSLIDALTGKEAIQHGPTNGDIVSPQSNPPGSPPMVIPERLKKFADKVTVTSPSISVDDQIRADRAAGISWSTLIKKYKISPSNLKKVLEPVAA